MKNLKNICDLHTHTVASIHAYSTVEENIREAKRKKLRYLGLSDHGYGMPDTTSPGYFVNLKVIPREMDGLRILIGVEANIMDYEGTLAEESIFHRVDYVIASLHQNCIAPGTMEENTAAVVKAISHPAVKILGHPDDRRYPLDYERIIATAIEHDVAIEVNNASHTPTTYRVGTRESTLTYLKLCEQMGATVVINTDAHFAAHVGAIDEALDVVKESRISPERILNWNEERLHFFLYGKT